MKERPILFSAAMVIAILDGSKTQTRRIVKPQPEFAQVYDFKGKRLYDGENRRWCWNGHVSDIWTEVTEALAPHCPYGKIGDQLWVRETFMLESSYGCELDYKPSSSIHPVQWHSEDDGDGGQVRWFEQPHYRATEPDAELTNPDTDERIKWRPSIFMPRWASRIQLEITDVRVEKLKAISEGDIIAEGCPPQFLLGQNWYRPLWESINGPGSWEANPYIWAISIKRIEVSK